MITSHFEEPSYDNTGCSKILFPISIFHYKISFRVLFRNTNHVTDRLNKFKFGARFETDVHSAR
jgi:hypothetical protein